MERKVELTDVFADGPIVRIPYDELDIKVVAEPVKHGHWLAVKGWDDDLGELDSAEPFTNFNVLVEVPYAT